MSSNLLTLPAELKIKIATLLVPGIDRPHDFPVQCRTLTKDIESIVHSFQNLSRFSRVCKETRTLCDQMIHNAVLLRFDKICARMADKSAGRMVFPPHRTWFLGVYYPRSAGDLLAAGASLLAPENLMTMTFKQFPSVTTLRLADFPFSLEYLRALQHLTALKTLSIRFPNGPGDSVPSLEEIQSLRSMPQVSNIHIESIRINACPTLGRLLKLFENSVDMLSITGSDYGSGENCFIRDLLSQDEWQKPVFARLKHVSIDFLEYDSRSLRQFVSSTKALESISVDSRGIIGFLPLFYVIDLLRMASGEHFDISPILNYDAQQADMSLDHSYIMSRLERAGIWTARMERFFCSFTVVQTEMGPVKVLEKLELIFASMNETCDSINTSLMFCDLLKFVHPRAPTFKRLRALTVGISPDFESRETEAQIQVVVSMLVQHYLPSIMMVRVHWGTLRTLIWRRPGAPDMMDVDPVFL